MIHACYSVFWELIKKKIKKIDFFFLQFNQNYSNLFKFEMRFYSKLIKMHLFILNFAYDLSKL